MSTPPPTKKKKEINREVIRCISSTDKYEVCSRTFYICKKNNKEMEKNESTNIILR